MSFVTRHNYATGAEGTTPAGRVNRQGSLVVVPQKMQWALEGRVFTSGHGSETTPLTAVAYDQDQPEFVLSVPTGTTVVPLNIRVHTEGSTGTAKEVIIWRVTNNIGDGTSTAATSAATNHRMGGAPAAATPRHLYTANVTLTGYVEMWRDGTTIASIAPFTYDYSPEFPLVLIGPASLGLQFDGTTTQPTFFMTATWAEFVTGDI